MSISKTNNAVRPYCRGWMNQLEKNKEKLKNRVVCTEANRAAMLFGIESLASKKNDSKTVSYSSGDVTAIGQPNTNAAIR